MGIQSLPTVSETPHKDPPGLPPLSAANEVAQLRQRGLAKRLNKHFANSISQVEIDLANAEECLRAVESRKAKINEFAPASQAITKLDAIHTTLANWKKECKKKEQENIMLYRKYVEKFGGSIKLARPEDLVTPKKVPKAPSVSLLASADIDELTNLFDEATANANGIPDILRTAHSMPQSSIDRKELEEILEEESLPDPDAPCKSLGISPKTPVTTTMESDDDSSVVSGLTTLNSQVTREVLNDVENKVLAFLAEETENIRKLLDEEEEDGKSKMVQSIASRPSQVGSTADQSLDKAESMVKAMEMILNEFKKAEAETNETSNTPLVRRIDAGNNGEEWYEHFDEISQRHYYVEAKTNVTQWHRPPSVMELSSDSMSSICDSSSGRGSIRPLAAEPKVLDYADFKPETRDFRRSSRIEKYRAKRRRQRNRRLVVLAVVFASLGAGFAYYKHSNPEQVEKMIEAASVNVVNTVGWIDNAKTQKVVESQKEAKVSSTKRAKNIEHVPKKVELEEGTTIPESGVTDNFTATKASLPFESPKKSEETVAANDSIEKIEEKAIGLWKDDSRSVYQEVNRKCRERGRYCGTHYV